MQYTFVQFPDNTAIKDQLFYAIVCAILIPQCQNNELFTKNFQKIFQNTAALPHKDTLQNALKNLRPQYLPNALANLVTTYLIPKLKITETTSDLDCIAKFESITKYKIQIHTMTLFENMAANIIPILYINNTYSAVIDITNLPTAQKNIFIMPELDAKCIALEGFTKKAFTQISTQLHLSKDILTINVKRQLNNPTILAPIADSDDSLTNLTLRTETGNLQSIIDSLRHEVPIIHQNNPPSYFRDQQTSIAANAGVSISTGEFSQVAIKMFKHAKHLFKPKFLLPQPVFLVLEVVASSIGFISSQYAHSFNQNIQQAINQILNNNLNAAIEMIGQNTNILQTSSRWLTLTREEYASGHFLNGLCFKQIENYPTALTYYTNAFNDAQWTSKTFLILLTGLHKITLLNLILKQAIPVTIDGEEVLSNSLEVLTQKCPQAFQDLYAHLINIIKTLSDNLSTLQPNMTITNRSIHILNAYMKFDDFYLLEYHNNGLGAFLKLFVQFYQGLLLGHLSNKTAHHLQAETRNHLLTLVAELDLQQHDELKTLALAKIRKLLENLNAFKKKYASQITQDQHLKQALTFMEPHIIKLTLMCGREARNYDETIAGIQRVFGFTDEQINQKVAAVDFAKRALLEIKEKFEVIFYSMEEWLACKRPLFVSPTHKQTPLHILVQLPLTEGIDRPMVMKMFNHLHPYVSIANHSGQQPIELLHQNDPYELRQELINIATIRNGIALKNNPNTKPVTIITYMQKAKELGLIDRINTIEDYLKNNTLTAEDWLDLGRLYYNGNEVAKNYLLAEQYFTNASNAGSANGSYNLGVMHHNNYAKNSNLKQVSRYYTLAMQQGYENIDKLRQTHDKLIIEKNYLSAYKKCDEKAFEKAYILQCIKRNQGTYPNTPDNEGQTLLARSAKRKLYKHCARLILFGATKHNQAPKDKAPLSNLSDSEKTRITNLRNQLTHLKAQLNITAPDILARCVVANAQTNTEQIKQSLTTLHSIADLKPLFELAKLAALKLHDTSGRKRFFDDAYDSDDDYTETVTEAQYFTINADAQHAHIGQITNYGPTGTDGQHAYGAYFTGTNTIYLGGEREPSKLKGTLLHELTHFLSFEVFKNNCDPYHHDDITNRNCFEQITQNTRNNLANFPQELDSIRHVFSCYAENCWHTELIVRIPQIIAEYPNNGLALLGTHVPDLLAYYRNEFLPPLEKHTKKIRARALSNWDEKLFTPTNQTFAFEQI